MDQRGGDPALVARRTRRETIEAEVNLRVGGVVRVVMRDPNKDVEYGGGGRYTEIEPPTRLAFTWIWDGDTRRTLIELDFEETDGVTRSASPTAACGTRGAVRSHEDGWRKLFDNLESHARGGPPRGVARPPASRGLRQRMTGRLGPARDNNDRPTPGARPLPLVRNKQKRVGAVPTCPRMPFPGHAAHREPA